MRQVIAYDRRGGDEELFNRLRVTPAMRLLLTDQLARDWVAAHATGENILDADVFSANQSTTAPNVYSNIKQINSGGRTAQIEVTMYTTVDNVGHSHREIFTFVNEGGGWRLGDIKYGPDSKRPLLLHDHVRTFLKPGAKPAIKPVSKYGPTVGPVFSGSSAGGQAKPEIDKWFLTSPTVRCANAKGDDIPCKITKDTKFKTFYSSYGYDAIVFAHYSPDPTGNGVSLAAALAHKSENGWDVRSIPNIMGENPAKVEFIRNEATFTTSITRDGDPHCCPSGIKKYSVRLSSN